MRFLKIFFFFSMIAALTCCVSSSKPPRASKNNYDSENRIEPEFIVYHNSQSTSRLYFKINSKDLLYTRQIGSLDFTSRLLIHYELTATERTNEIIDSSSVVIADVNNDKIEKFLTSQFDVKAPFGKICYLSIKVKDLNRNSSYSTTLTIDKATKFGKQFFLPTYKNGEIFFKDHLSGTDTVVLYSKSTDKLYANYYQRDFPLPPPPFSGSSLKPFDYKADSTFIIPEDSEHRFLIPKISKGFYHFRADTSNKAGFTLFKFSEGFPLITTPTQLVQALRYITSKQEYEKLAANPDKKSAVDNFWLGVAGNKDRAKNLIRKYYNRVEEANREYTSYVEGWKTDRGMIYIVYGPPSSVYENAYSETWTYHEDKTFNSFTFTFVKVLNPFTENDFMLDRSGIYKNSWYQALEYWRQGRIYFEY